MGAVRVLLSKLQVMATARHWQRRRPTIYVYSCTRRGPGRTGHPPPPPTPSAVATAPRGPPPPAQSLPSLKGAGRPEGRLASPPALRPPARLPRRSAPPAHPPTADASRVAPPPTPSRPPPHSARWNAPAAPEGGRQLAAAAAQLARPHLPSVDAAASVARTREVGGGGGEGGRPTAPPRRSWRCRHGCPPTPPPSSRP